MEPGAATAAPQPAAGILDLPDALLSHVFVLAGRSERASVTQVCRRFQRLFYNEPALWRSLRISRWFARPPTGADYAVFVRLLHRVLGMVQDIRLPYYELADADSAKFLAELQPAMLARQLTALTQLRLCGYTLPSVLPAALASLPCLNRLVLSVDNDIVSSQLGAALRPLAASLTYLDLYFPEVSAEVAAAVGTLSQLRYLGLGATADYLQPEVARAVAQLSSLETLHFEWEWPMNEGLPDAAADWAAALAGGRLPRLSTLYHPVCGPLPPALANGLACQIQLTALELSSQLGDVRQLSRLTRLRCMRLRDEKHDASTWQEAQLPSLSSFPHLEAYSFGAESECQIVVGGTRLRWCEYGDDNWMEWELLRQFDWPQPAVDSMAAARLEVAAAVGLNSLDQLLEGLVPPSVRLRYLSLRETNLPPSAVLGCATLATLLSLSAPDTSPATLRALPRVLPYLTSLKLGCSAPAASLQPDQLPSMPALRELALVCRVDGTGGSSVDACMPALLSLLPQLRSMHVTAHISAEARETLQQQLAAGTWLAGLRGISALSFWDCRLDKLPAGPYLEGLTHLELGLNEFKRLPHSLAAATHMQHLSLAFNSQLVLTAEDVEQVLARMPGLTQLHLTSCPRLSPAVHDSLLRQLPKLTLLI